MSTRLTFLFALMATLAILGTSLYLQFVDGIMPCPLCTLQRIAFAMIAILFFAGFIFHRRRFIVMPVCLLASLFSIAGFIFAARQTWLQLFPSADGGECGVSLAYMIDALPWHEVAAKIFAGSAECSTKSFEFLSLSIPEWGVIWFAIFFCISTIMLIRSGK